MRDELEQDLMESLARVPAPEGFADRVMERVAKKQRLRFLMPQRTPHVWRAIAAMALISVLFGAAELVHRQEERKQAELMKYQFEVAMRVTGKTLDGVGARISRAGTKQEKREQ